MKIGGAAAISGGAIALLVSTFVLSTGTGASACTPGTVNIDAVAKVTDSIDGYSVDQLANAAQPRMARSTLSPLTVLALSFSRHSPPYGTGRHGRSSAARRD